MENNQRNSRKRLNSLILLVAFTAVMLIVSTYAWFSTQKNVTLSGIYGKVNVAEGLQISLDAKTWKNEIDFSDFTAKYEDADDDGEEDDYVGLVSSTYVPDGTLENPKGDGTIKNVIPSELLPVSTTGTETINSGKVINMYNGTNENGNELAGIYLVDELSATSNPGYYAIDLYLQNSSAAGVTSDVLQLEPNSAITINTDKASTGLQNTLRVGLAVFNDLGVAVDGTKGQSDILTEAAGKNIKDVCIWEPRADAHVDYIVNNQKIAYSAIYDDDDLITGYTWSAIASNTKHNTWALDADAAVDDEDTEDIAENMIENVYFWNAENTKLTETKTLQTLAAGFTDPIELVSATNGTSKITMAPSQYVKARLYIWLEGQDVDCINHASLGGGVTIDFGFSKPGSANAEEEPAG